MNCTTEDFRQILSDKLETFRDSPEMFLMCISNGLTPDEAMENVSTFTESILTDINDREIALTNSVNGLDGELAVMVAESAEVFKACIEFLGINISDGGCDLCDDLKCEERDPITVFDFAVGVKFCLINTPSGIEFVLWCPDPDSLSKFINNLPIWKN